MVCGGGLPSLVRGGGRLTKAQARLLFCGFRDILPGGIFRKLKTTSNLQGLLHESLKFNVTDRLCSCILAFPVMIAARVFVQGIKIDKKGEELVSSARGPNFPNDCTERVSSGEFTRKEILAVGFKNRPNLVHNIPKIAIHRIVVFCKHRPICNEPSLCCLLDIPSGDSGVADTDASKLEAFPVGLLRA